MDNFDFGDPQPGTVQAAEQGCTCQAKEDWVVVEKACPLHGNFDVDALLRWMYD